VRFEQGAGANITASSCENIARAKESKVHHAALDRQQKNALPTTPAAAPHRKPYFSCLLSPDFCLPINPPHFHFLDFPSSALLLSSHAHNLLQDESGL
jgi:hypothetical protein